MSHALTLVLLGALLGVACATDAIATPTATPALLPHKLQEGCMTDETEPTAAQLEAAILKYEPQFRKHPHFSYMYPSQLWDVNTMEWTYSVGLVVLVRRLSDQSELPEDQRIPSCVDGIPVLVTDGGKADLGVEVIE